MIEAGDGRQETGDRRQEEVLTGESRACQVLHLTVFREIEKREERREKRKERQGDGRQEEVLTGEFRACQVLAVIEKKIIFY